MLFPLDSGFEPHVGFAYSTSLAEPNVARRVLRTPRATVIPLLTPRRKNKKDILLDVFFVFCGVSNGIRTHGLQGHNLAL